MTDDLKMMSDEDRARILKTSLAEVQAAKEAFGNVIRSMFPDGAHVRWYEHPYFHTGAVTGYSGDYSLIIRRDGDRGRTVVHPHAIIRAVEVTESAREGHA